MPPQTAKTLSGKQFRIPSDLSLVDYLRESLGQFLNHWLIDEEMVSHWKLILSEAVTNAMLHGNGGEPDKTVEVCWYIKGESVVLEIIDQGNGFPPEKLKNASLPEDPLATGGRGLFLIRDFCDDWQQWTGPGGHRQVITKAHDELDEENTLELELEQAMDEIALCYESLAAFYRLGDSLIQSENVTSFVESAVDDLKHLVRGDKVSIHFMGSLQSTISNSLSELDAVVDSVGSSPIQQSVLRTGEEYVWETQRKWLMIRIYADSNRAVAVRLRLGAIFLVF